MRAIAAGAIVLLISATQAAAACLKERSNFFFGSDTQMTWKVVSGTACAHDIRVYSGAIHRIGITQRPQFGRAGTNGFSAFAYTAPAGYVGNDRFVVTLVGTGQRTSGTTNIVVNVEVVPTRTWVRRR